MEGVWDGTDCNGAGEAIGAGAGIVDVHPAEITKIRMIVTDSMTRLLCITGEAHAG